MCESKGCQHKKESPLKDWKHRCKFGPDGKRLQPGTVIVGWNDLATTHKELAKECIDDATKFTGGSKKRKTWKCKDCGHKWPAIVGNRTRLGSGCKPCGYKRMAKKQSTVPYKKSAAYLFPHLVKEHRGPGDLRSLGPSSDSMENWECKDCGHKWPSTVGDRTRGQGCKPCAKSGIKLEKPSFFYLIKKPDRFKIGIANHNSGRLNKHRRAGWELIESIDMIGYAAKSLEDACLAAFNSKGVPLGQFGEIFDGYTESWYKRHIYVRSIRGLCRKLGIDLDAFLAA